jgi:hypothetical protein
MQGGFSAREFYRDQFWSNVRSWVDIETHVWDFRAGEFQFVAVVQGWSLMSGLVEMLERDLFTRLSVSRNISPQTDKFENLKPAFNVVCSWCGAVIRSSNVEAPEQMCLICHARMLNDYFQRLKHHQQKRRS